MTGLQTVWTAVFAVAVVLFVAVEVVVMVGGAGDIADMLRTLLRQADQHGGRDRTRA